MRKQPPTKLICVIFGLFGLGMFLMSLVQFYENIRLLSSGVKTRGEVVSMTERDRRIGDETRGAISRNPTVTFTTEAGEVITFRSEIGSSSEFEVGDQVTVYYPEDAPESARIVSFLQLWFLPIILFVVGAPVAFVCFLVFKFSSSNVASEALERKKAQLSSSDLKQIDKITDILDKK